MKSVFEYDDYRRYLKDYYRENKTKKRNFNYRYFAEKAGLSSVMHFKLVAEGDRNLSSSTIQKFIKGLQLHSKEAEYFENLVLFCQSKSSSEKTLYLKRLTKLSSKKLNLKSLRKKQQASLFSHWHLPLIYELVRLDSFQEDPHWISTRLNHEITPSIAKHSLEMLLDNGLLARNKNGKIIQKNYSVCTDNEVENLLVREFQKKLIERSLIHIDLPLSEREYGFALVATSLKKIEVMKAKIKEFVEEANVFLSEVDVDEAENNVEPVEALYALSVQLQPAIRARKKRRI